MLRREAGRRLAHNDVVDGREDAIEEARMGRVEDWMMREERERVWYIIWRSIVNRIWGVRVVNSN